MRKKNPLHMTPDEVDEELKRLENYQQKKQAKGEKMSPRMKQRMKDLKEEKRWHTAEKRRTDKEESDAGEIKRTEDAAEKKRLEAEAKKKAADRKEELKKEWDENRGGMHDGEVEEHLGGLNHDELDEILGEMGLSKTGSLKSKQARILAAHKLVPVEDMDDAQFEEHLKAQSHAALKRMARKAKIAGFTTKDKDELREALLAHRKKQGKNIEDMTSDEIDEELALFIASLAAAQSVESIGNSKPVDKLELLKTISHSLK